MDKTKQYVSVVYVVATSNADGSVLKKVKVNCLGDAFPVKDALMAEFSDAKVFIEAIKEEVNA